MSMELKPSKSIRSQIVEHFRAEIRLGKLKAGDRLASARALAEQFGTAEANVHHALATLVKEGMLTRRPKAGTVVTNGMEKLTCAAIYLSWFYIQRGENFTRLLITMLEEKLARRGIKCIVIYDTPAQNGLERLKELAESRQIQGAILRSLSPEQYTFFARLPIPFTAISAMRIQNRVSFFSTEIIRQIVERLKLDGIKKLGIISSANLDFGKKRKVSQDFQSLFLRKLLDSGFKIRREWVFDGGSYGDEMILDSSIFAYTGFEKIWNLTERPEALLVFSDDMVSGLAMSFYHRHVNVPEDIRLYIHKTEENELILPFPCTLLENSISELAEALVRQIMDLSEGHAPSQKTLACNFRDWIP